MLNGSSFGKKFVGSFLHWSLGEFIIHVNSFNHMEFPWGRGMWEWEHKSFWYTILRSVSLDANWLPFATSEGPVSHVVNWGWSSWGSWWGSSKINNFSTSLLYSWCEILDFPVLVNQWVGWCSSNSAVSNIWVHCWWVISPDCHLMNFSSIGIGVKRQLCECSVVIKSGHCSEVLSWDSLSMLLKNKAIGVSWVSYNNSFAISWWVIRHSFTNSNENFTIILKKIGSLHTWSSWLSSNHESIVNILPSDSWVTCADNIS